MYPTFGVQFKFSDNLFENKRSFILPSGTKNNSFSEKIHFYKPITKYN